MLSPHSLLSHGGSNGRGKDIVYNVVQTLQSYDTAFSDLTNRVQLLFGKKSATTNEEGKISNENQMIQIHKILGASKSYVQRLHVFLQQLKGLAKLVESLPDSSLYGTYFSTLSLLDAIVLVTKIVDAYSVQICVNEDILKDLFKHKERSPQLLLLFSLQPVTHDVKHSRAMLYVDCIK